MPTPAPQDWLSRAGRYHPRLLAAAMAMNDNDLPRAEPLLREHLKDDPFDVAAIRMFAELAGRIGRYRDAESLLRRALDLSPAFTAARANLALVLYRLNRPAEAIAELDRVAAEEPDNPGHANLQAAAYGRLGGFDEAIALYEKVLAERPDAARVWMSFGHMLKTVGRQDDGVAAYRRAIALMPQLGEAWWSLANLKTLRFDDADLAAMEAALGAVPPLPLAGGVRGGPSDAPGGPTPGPSRKREGKAPPDDADRLHLHFALGKALEDRGDAPAAFAHYATGNALRRARLPYDADETARFVDRLIEIATPQFLAERAGAGCDAPDPVFVLGMPRAGSTLVEQILASHSQVEGTSELPDIPALARRDPRYPLGLPELTRDDLAALGEEYLKRTRIQRRSERPRFIDKLPNNWAHVVFIHLILPNATIIDARRHPLACCFSNFKQHFARGQPFSYDLADMGRYYRDYARLLAHVDRVLPGRVHRVIHEHLVRDTEAEVRALLAHCGLGFEPACLAAHRTARAVRTASSEQVRRPITAEGLGAWQPFARFLDPLVEALGPVLRVYPQLPAAW